MYAVQDYIYQNGSFDTYKENGYRMYVSWEGKGYSVRSTYKNEKALTLLRKKLKANASHLQKNITRKTPI